MKTANTAFDRILDRQIEEHFGPEYFSLPSRYTVKTAAEEFDCHHCGGLVAVEDSAVSVDCDDRGAELSFCSGECNERDLQQWRGDST